MADTNSPKKILIISPDKNLREVLRFCFDGWAYEVLLYETPPKDITVIKKASPSVIIVDVQKARRTDLEICAVLKDDFITAYTPVVALIDKKQLRSQLLNIKYGVDDYLIKPPDPLDLRVRVEMAMKRAQHNFYASPLTGLPGGRIVEDAVKERLHGAKEFTYGYIDLDNFKYYNDTYGYVKGDRIIMQTAYILYSNISRCGNRDDFIGHIGGDDFAFITTPEKYAKICRGIIRDFNSIVPFHYSAEDRAKGYIIAKDRTHTIKKIPLMSVSIAIVNATKGSGFKNPIQINEKAAEVKRYLKGLEGSKFMADRRNLSGQKGCKPEVYKVGKLKKTSYKPLGQALLSTKRISEDELDEALKLHWRRGIRLGEILRELKYSTEKDISDAVKQGTSTTKNVSKRSKWLQLTDEPV